MIHISGTVPVEELTALVTDLAKTGHPTLRRAAARLGLSTRSLQRALQRQGLTYTDLVDDSRYRVAQRLLRDSGHSVAEVAAMLGYRDPSSFSRAFMRWAGCSPRQYRVAVREGDRIRR